MSKMQLNGSRLRVEFNEGDSFIGLQEVPNFYGSALAVHLFQRSMYWVLANIRLEGKTLLCFPSVEYFSEWCDKNKGNYEVIYNPQGIDALTDMKPSDPQNVTNGDAKSPSNHNKGV